MKKDWKNFIQNLAVGTEFLHRDKLEEQYEIKDENIHLHIFKMIINQVYLSLKMKWLR